MSERPEERLVRWVQDAESALGAATVIGEREGTHLNYANMDRLRDADAFPIARAMAGVVKALRIVEDETDSAFLAEVARTALQALDPLGSTMTCSCSARSGTVGSLHDADCPLADSLGERKELNPRCCHGRTFEECDGTCTDTINCVPKDATAFQRRYR